jgi:hypothetical protein
MNTVRPWGVMAVMSLVLLSGCASLLPRRDPLCAEIAIFANSIDDDAVHSVELLTDSTPFAQNFRPERHCQMIGHSMATGRNTIDSPTLPVQ